MEMKIDVTKNQNGVRTALNNVTRFRPVNLLQKKHDFFHCLYRRAVLELYTMIYKDGNTVNWAKLFLTNFLCSQFFMSYWDSWEMVYHNAQFRPRCHNVVILNVFPEADTRKHGCFCISMHFICIPFNSWMWAFQMHIIFLAFLFNQFCFWALTYNLCARNSNSECYGLWSYFFMYLIIWST